MKNVLVQISLLPGNKIQCDWNSAVLSPEQVEDILHKAYVGQIRYNEKLQIDGSNGKKKRVELWTP